LFEQIKDFGNIQEKKNLGGEFTEKQRLGMLHNESTINNREKQAKNLEEYARESESEREDEDIYSHYINKMNEAKKEKALEDSTATLSERMASKELDDLSKMLPDTPRFEGFFKSQS